MSKELFDGKAKKIKYRVYTLIALAISISVLLLFSSNFGLIFMGNIPTFSTAVEAVFFLVVWLFYGMVMGYKKKNGFIKFISFYWGISGLIVMIAKLMAPIGGFAIILIPVWLIIFVPTYGLEYFMHPVGSPELHYGLICLTLSWSSGVIGYLLGSLLRKLKVSMLSYKDKRSY